MRESRNGIIEDFIKKKTKLTLILIYNIVTIVVLAIFYPLIPILMGYAPNFIESTIALGSSYNLQYIVVILFTVIIGTIYLLFALKGMGRWSTMIGDIDKYADKIKAIRRKCINLPYLLYFIQLTFINVPVIIAAIIISIMNNMPIVLAVKVITVIFSLFSLAAVFSYAFAKKLFTKILFKTFRGEKLEGKRINLRTKIFIQVIPMLIVAILFTGTLGYSRLIEEKGEVVFNIYHQELQNKFSEIDTVKDENHIFDILMDIKLKDIYTDYFVVKPDGSIITSSGVAPTKTFIYYINNPYNDIRIYGDTNEVQGALIKVKGINGEYIAGIRFQLSSDTTVLYFLFGLFALLIVNVFVLMYFSKTLSGEISLVAESLTEIAEGEKVDLDRKIAVTSNDEIGDLIVAFNKILDREKEHLKEVEEKHEIMMEQERLASLGQLMGGIAHNMRTPIMSISGAIEGLKELINEYSAAIDDPQVMKEDHKEIAKEMLEWTDKMRPYCSYMSDIITAIRGQTLQSSSDAALSFTLGDLLKRVDILMSHELKKYHCELKTSFMIDMKTEIRGEMSALVQILNNLVLNAIDSYDGEGGDITLNVKVENGRAVFEVKDHGKGIPENLQGKIFKQMITTKGKSGTGLGLYMSNSSLKARFGGKMWFESEEGRGTSFYISVPIKE
ncbi:MAG: HAMP domain-containing sensor histidine kinase [Bacillota bacterium]